MRYAELPDEYGLSQDSLRGSADHVQHALVDASGQFDPFTRREVTRGALSKNELLALHSAGTFVDEQGKALTDPADSLVYIPPPSTSNAPVSGAFPTAQPPRYTPQEFVEMMRQSGMAISLGDDKLAGITSPSREDEFERKSTWPYATYPPEVSPASPSNPAPSPAPSVHPPFGGQESGSEATSPTRPPHPAGEGGDYRPTTPSPVEPTDPTPSEC